MKRILTLCIGAILLAAVAVAAGVHQHGGGAKQAAVGGTGQHHVAFMVQALSLNDEQKAAATRLHVDFAAKVAPVAAQHHQQRTEINALLDSENPDPTELGRKIIAEHATSRQLATMHQGFSEKFTALLNADQIAKLKSLQAHHGGGH